MKQQELIPHLFRTEYRKITAVLCRHFGLAHMEIAEDIASETFLAAMETWSYKGIPENPEAWLYTVAKNKTKNYTRRQQFFNSQISGHLKRDAGNDQQPGIDLSEENITDSLLQMLFAICQPSVSTEGQIALALRILCGFSIDEIANAFLTNKETINKRLFRAKEKLREQKDSIEFPSEKELESRLDTVLATLYLLFNEGYYSESQEPVLREELSQEAMRLVLLLIENEQTNTPAVNALYSLMCFHSSRFPARKSESGEIILYNDQDENNWDHALISKGAFYLHLASAGNKLSTYHLQAAIAYWHTIKEDNREKWKNILQLYDQLLQIDYSPVAALNRIYAFSKLKSKKESIAEAEKLQLADNHYYYTLLGELYKEVDKEKSIENFQLALSLAKTSADKKVISKNMLQAWK